MNSQLSPPRPKDLLKGHVLKSGWVMGEPLVRPPGATGSTFATGYIAERGKERAFVKAIDFVHALKEQDPMAALQLLTNQAVFERDTLRDCAEADLGHVIRYIDYEVVPGPNGDIARQVFCLVMEVGNGDLRATMGAKKVSSCAWAIKVMTETAKGIHELHKLGIAHQDIKPSNVISVPNSKKTSPFSYDETQLKISDLGRVTRRGTAGPFDHLPFPGDLNYLPPEHWYSNAFSPIALQNRSWSDAREAADAYMLGSLMIFILTGMTLQAVVVESLPNAFRPSIWSGGYDQELIPVLIAAHTKAIASCINDNVYTELGTSLKSIALEITHPDPAQRGDRKSRRSITKAVGMDRISQRLNALYARAKAIEIGRSKR
jgi:serine/threonine protein kinase